MRISLTRIKVIILFTITLFFAIPPICGASPKIASIPEGASFELMQDVEIAGSEFYVYNPSHPYDWAVLSRELNPVIFVYPDMPYESEAEAWKAMVDNKLVGMAEQDSIYVIMPKPLNGSSWTQDDLELYQTIQFWLFGGSSPGPPFLVWDYPLRSGNSHTYIIGEGTGATFVNNVLSKHANRIAGILTFGGSMDDFTEGLPIPAYLVNASTETEDYYMEVNETDTESMPGTYVNSEFSLKKVITKHSGRAFDYFKPQIISDAWTELFSQTARVNVHGAMFLDDSVWYLNDRPNYDELGITRVDHLYEELPNGMEATWYDYVPDFIYRQPAHNKNKEQAPLVIALHGLSGDPIDQAESPGWANKASEEGFVVIAPAFSPRNGFPDWDEAEDMLLALVEYAESTYPIDESRIYLAGYSMGGWASALVGLRNPYKFAAIAVMGYDGTDDPEAIANVELVKDNVDLPFMVLRGALEATLVEGQPAIEGFATNGIPLMDIDELPHGTPDYAAYPYWGFPTMDNTVYLSKDLHFDVSYMYKGDKALGKFVIFEEGAHTHEDFYATLAWDFFSEFHR